MNDSIQEQIDGAYRTMASEAEYRPAAPSDGFGNILGPEDELDLDAEVRDYAAKWWSEENAGQFYIGSADFRTRPATIFAVEAARVMAGGTGGERHAERLLRLALNEMERVTEESS